MHFFKNVANQFLKMLNTDMTQLLHAWAVAHEKLKHSSHRDSDTQISQQLHLQSPETGDNLKSSSVSEWINKSWSLHTKGYYKVIKKNKLLMPETSVDFKIIILSQRSQHPHPKNEYILSNSTYILVHYRKWKLIYSDRNRSVVEGKEREGIPKGLRGG